jgi:hypothetical protein
MSKQLTKPKAEVLPSAPSTSCAGERNTVGDSFIRPCARDPVMFMLNEESCTKVKLCRYRRILSRIVFTIFLPISRRSLLFGWLMGSIFITIRSQHWRWMPCSSASICPLGLVYSYCGKLAFMRFFLQTNTTGKHTFNWIENFMRTRGIGWEKCIDLYSSGAIYKLKSWHTTVLAFSAFCIDTSRQFRMFVTLLECVGWSSADF